MSQKSILITFTFFILVSIPNTAFATTTINDTIISLGLPVVIVETKNHEEPSAEVAVTPENCWGSSIKNATKIEGSVVVISPLGDTLYCSGDYVKKTSGMTIKIRGNWSAQSPKKAYKIKLQKNGDMLARGNDDIYGDKEWALLREDDGNDSILMLRIITGLTLSKLVLKSWTPSCQYVNFIMNGDYRGLYLLTELITRNPSCRINVNKQNGFICELDPYWWTEDTCIETLIFQDAPLKYTFKYPDAEDVTNSQITQLGDYIKRAEQAISDQTYSRYIDIDNWARWLIAQDMLGIADGAGSNQYFFINNIQADSIIKRGPLWDFDSSFSTSGRWTSIHNIWYYDKLLQDSINFAFAKAYKQIYQNESDDILDSVLNMLDGFALLEWKQSMDSSIVKDDYRWSKSTYSMDYSIHKIKTWFQQRKIWLDQEIAKINTNNETSINVYKSQDTDSFVDKYFSKGGLIIHRNGKTYNIWGQLINNTK